MDPYCTICDRAFSDHDSPSDLQACLDYTAWKKNGNRMEKCQVCRSYMTLAYDEEFGTINWVHLYPEDEDKCAVVSLIAHGRAPSPVKVVSG